MPQTQIDRSVMDDARRQLEAAARRLRWIGAAPEGRDTDRLLSEALANIRAALARLE